MLMKGRFASCTDTWVFTAPSVSSASTRLDLAKAEVYASILYFRKVLCRISAGLQVQNFLTGKVKLCALRATLSNVDWQQLREIQCPLGAAPVRTFFYI